jgi:hypothetical protein
MIKIAKKAIGCFLLPHHLGAAYFVNCFSVALR